MSSSIAVSLSKAVGVNLNNDQVKNIIDIVSDWIGKNSGRISEIIDNPLIDKRDLRIPQSKASSSTVQQNVSNQNIPIVGNPGVVLPFEIKLPFNVNITNPESLRDSIVSTVSGIDQFPGSKYGNLTSIDSNLVEIFYRYIDQYILNSACYLILSKYGFNIKFEISNKMKSVAAKTIIDNLTNQVILRVSESIFDNITVEAFINANETGVPLKVNGISINSRLQALEIVVEHEMLHILIDITNLANSTNDNRAHGELFQTMAKQLFGHTEYQHSLLLSKGDTSVSSSASQPYLDVSLLNDKFAVHRMVYFVNSGQTIMGTITKMNPQNAEVQLRDGKVYQIPYTSLHLMG